MRHGVCMGKLVICLGLPKLVDLGRYQDDDIHGASLNELSMKSGSLDQIIVLLGSGLGVRRAADWSLTRPLRRGVEENTPTRLNALRTVPLSPYCMFWFRSGCRGAVISHTRKPEDNLDSRHLVSRHMSFTRCAYSRSFRIVCIKSQLRPVLQTGMLNERRSDEAAPGVRIVNSSAPHKVHLQLQISLRKLY